MRSFEIQEMSWEEAIEAAKGYEYALMYTLSAVLFGRVEEVLEQADWRECMEARFFNQAGELHLFDYNGRKKAVCVMDGQGEQIQREYELAGIFQKCGKYLTVKEYLEPDEDGQMVTVMTRLSGVRRED